MSGATCLLDEGFLMVGQIGRDSDIEDDDEVFECAVALDASLALQTHFLAGLSAWGNFEFELAVGGADDEFAAKQGCPHVDGHVGFHLGGFSWLATGACATSATHAHVAKDGLEEVAHATFASHIEGEAFEGIASTTCAEATELLSLLPVLAILVVLGSLVRVVEHFVCLVQHLELRLGFGIVGVKVGMELLGALAVCRSDIFLWGVLGDAHHFVVIDECHIELIIVS